jgi:hypothetical protein
MPWNTLVLFARADSVIAYTAVWARRAPDSVLVDGHTIPSPDWRLRRDHADLRGTATLVHDFVINGESPNSVWPVWLVPIPCSAVPATGVLAGTTR